jgi:hypothetical protein
MKTKDINTLIPVNYDAIMHLRWLATDAVNASVTIRQLFNGYYDTSNPAYTDLINQTNIYIAQVESDINVIKQYINNLPNI